MSKYNRLANLEDELNNILSEQFGIINTEVTSTIKDLYTENYYMQGYLLAKETGLNLNFGLIPQNVLTELVKKPNVSGKSLKDILGYSRYEQLTKERQAMVQGFVNGDSYRRMAQNLTDVFDKSYNDVIRILRTEGTRSSNYAQVDLYDRAEAKGIDIVRIWKATLDDKTRQDHRELDGEEADEDGYFYLGKLKAKCPGDFGVAEEDINCRCNVIATVKGYDIKERASNKLGDMTYEEWKRGQK
jgi:SPP1 gp7 family putative phage head morphogenesis protein